MKNTIVSDKPMRVRNFSTIVYQESAPLDWLDTLSRFLSENLINMANAVKPQLSL